MNQAFRIQRAAEDAQRIAAEAQLAAAQWREVAQKHEATSRKALAAAEEWRRQYERTYPAVGTSSDSLATIDSGLYFDTVQQDVTGRVLAQCIDGPKTDAEFLTWLRTMPTDMLVLVGYVGNDGNAYALSESMLKGSTP